MGFAEQLQEIIGRLPGGHQTVLFSATLPKLLVEFARAGEGAAGAGLGAGKLISTWGVGGGGWAVLILSNSPPIFLRCPPQA